MSLIKIKKIKVIYNLKIRIRNIKYLFKDTLYLILNGSELSKIIDYIKSMFKNINYVDFINTLTRLLKKILKLVWKSIKKIISYANNTANNQNIGVLFKRAASSYIHKPEDIQ